jgi:hypothetical protein
MVFFDWAITRKKKIDKIVATPEIVYVIVFVLWSYIGYESKARDKEYGIKCGAIWNALETPKSNISNSSTPPPPPFSPLKGKNLGLFCACSLTSLARWDFHSQLTIFWPRPIAKGTNMWGHI